MSSSSPQAADLVAAEVVVSGLVQGVWYRAFTQQAAEELGLTGWVRNLPDGRVQAEVEGQRKRVEDLLSRLRVGPPGAVVSDVAVTWKAATGRPRGFTIAR
jgi:acylphosphatase